MAIKNTKLGGTDWDTPSARVKPTDLNDTFDASARWLDAIGITFKNQAQLLYNSAYLGFDSNLNIATGVPNLENVEYDIFNSDSVTYFSGIEYDSSDKLYKTQDNSEITDYWVDIYCDSVSGSWTTNDCAIKEISRTPTGRIYRLYCTSGTAQVKRASVISTLFKPTTVTDATTAKVISQITGLTALKPSDSADNGRKFSYGYGNWRITVDRPYSNSTYTGTFSDTTNNTDTEAWGVTTGSSGVIGGWYKRGKLDGDGSIPGTETYTFVSASYTGDNADTFATNTTSKRKSNPGNVELGVRMQNNDSGTTMGVSGLISYKEGTISWVNSTGSDQEMLNNYNYDFSIGFTESDYDQNENTFIEFQTSDLDTINDCIATWNSSIDADNTLTVSISADGTNYEEVTDATIHRFTDTGTNLYIKFEIDRVETSAVDKISEYAILYNVTE